MLPRAKAIDDKKGQEVGPFMPHFYNAWMAIHDRIYQGVDLLLQALQAASVFHTSTRTSATKTRRANGCFQWRQLFAAATIWGI